MCEHSSRLTAGIALEAQASALLDPRVEGGSLNTVYQAQHALAKTRALCTQYLFRLEPP